MPTNEQTEQIDNPAANNDTLPPSPLHTKEYFEIEKLKLEIKNLQKPLQRRFDFWQLTIPLFTGVVTIFVLYFNNFFDANNKYQMARKENLDIQIARNSSYNDSLKKSNDSIIVKFKYLDSVAKASVAIANKAKAEKAEADSAIAATYASVAKKDAYMARLLKGYNECMGLHRAIQEIKNAAAYETTTQMTGIYGQPGSGTSYPSIQIDSSKIDIPQPIIDTKAEYEYLKQLKKKKQKH